MARGLAHCLLGFAFAALPTMLASRASAQRPPSIVVAPEMPPPKRIAEQGESPRVMRLPADGFNPGIRADLGGQARFGVSEDRATWAFAFDVLAGASHPFERGGRWGVLGEGGYSFIGFSEHLASVGIGPHVRGLGPTVSEIEVAGRPAGLSGLFDFALVPRFVYGLAGDRRAIGLRTSAIAGLWLWSIELSHQYLSVEGRALHQIGFAFSPWPYGARF